MYEKPIEKRKEMEETEKAAVGNGKISFKMGTM